MLKINLLSIILISSLFSACGFHVPKNSTPINASMTGNANSAFVTELKKHLSANAKPSLHLEIGDEVKKQQTVSYKNGVSNSYTLILSVPIKVFRDKKLLLSKKLTASATVEELNSSQADTLQINSNYTQLRSEIVIRLLRRLKHLNEN